MILGQGCHCFEWQHSPSKCLNDVSDCWVLHIVGRVRYSIEYKLSAPKMPSSADKKKGASKVSLVLTTRGRKLHWTQKVQAPSTWSPGFPEQNRRATMSFEDPIPDQTQLSTE